MEAIYLRDGKFVVEDDNNCSYAGELVFNGKKSVNLCDDNVSLRTTSKGDIRFNFCGEDLGLFIYECDSYKFSYELTLYKVAYWLNKIQNDVDDFTGTYTDYLRDFLSDNEDDIDSDDYMTVKCLITRLF
jgi:hypothetical protein